MKDFMLNFLNGLITSTITFLIITFVPLPSLPLHLEKIIIFSIVAAIIGIIILRDKPIIHQVGTILGGVIAGFVIFNLGFPSEYIANSLIGGIIVGIIGTLSKFLGV